MTNLSLDTLTAPISAADSCGPDLDVVGDAGYLTFMAAAEGLLPATFYYPKSHGDPSRRDKPFDRSTVDFASQYEVIANLGKRTRDLRVLVLLAKFRVLDRSLSGFIDAIDAVAVLLEQYWDTVHPRGEDGDFTIRLVTLQSLDDMVPVILPLHYVPLFEDKRAGAVTYRSHLLAEGEVTPRGDEDKLDLSLIKNAFAEAALPILVERRDQFKRLSSALARIKDAFAKNGGRTEAIAFDRLTPLVEKIRALLESHVAMREPSAAEAAPPAGPSEEGAGDGAPAAAQAGDIANFADAAAALAAVAAYYARYEPSNPALLLVRQAEQLIGKSFFDAIRLLVPAHADEIKVQIGKVHGFDLPLERLAELAPAEGISDGTTEKTFTATTREAALRLLSDVASFYRAAEPSSPVAYLIERARALTGKDFLGLLKDMLPPDTLKSLEGGK
ncbi:MAG TPA: type VI secretion system ImpA family N-terminal domain-containing protein [Methylocella sp.]|nr:type VI secretion system ImpA family N-terminal domain-containing protein [Methylocella sp.]